MDAGTEVNVNHNHQLYYHFLGTEQSEDILCWNNLKNPTHILEARLADDGKVLITYIQIYLFYIYIINIKIN